MAWSRSLECLYVRGQERFGGSGRGVFMFPFEADSARIISCDVFDTLLQRDHRSEHSRIRAIASLACARLRSELGIVLPAPVIWRARIEVQRQAYRALALVRPAGDVRFADMVDAMARLLALDDRGAAILVEAELEIERRQLSPNRVLLTWLTGRARQGCRIIAVSDIYHSSAVISDLLEKLAPGHPVAAVYTSADLDATKRSGALFAAVLRIEQAQPGEVWHVGDDHLADWRMARAAGLHAWQVQRPAPMRIWRKCDGLLSRLIDRLLPIDPLHGLAGGERR